MTKRQREKAVLIAQDVLKLLRTKKNLTVQARSAYINAEAEELLPAGESLQDHLKTLLSKPCEVCAKGALLLAKVDLFNKCKIPVNLSGGWKIGEQGLNDGEWCTQNLTDVWPVEMLTELESWFEYGPTDGLSNADHLKAMMKNIIANGGIFTLYADAIAAYEVAEVRVQELADALNEAKVALREMDNPADW